MLVNALFLAVGIALWFLIARDAYAVEQRTGRRVWGLAHRTWAWIVAITFLGFVPYLVGRVQTTRTATPPPTPPQD